MRAFHLGSTEMSPHIATPRKPRDPGACEGGESTLWACILAFSFSRQKKGMKLGHIRDLQIKIVPEGPSMAGVGGCAEGSSDLNLP